MQKHVLTFRAVLMGAAIVASMGVLGLPAFAAKAEVAQTGRTTPYAPGDDGAIQAGVPWPVPRFTDKRNGTIEDRLTGLIWLRIAKCFGALRWPQALAAANTLAQGQCGLTDKSQPGEWRLPNVSELRSLVDVDFIRPALSNAAGTAQWPEGDAFSGVQVNVYWSSTTLATRPDVAWFVHFEFGHTGHDSKEFGLTPYWVWPVRGGQ